MERKPHGLSSNHIRREIGSAQSISVRDRFVDESKADGAVMSNRDWLGN
jgi:hypothetical protein